MNLQRSATTMALAITLATSSAGVGAQGDGLRLSPDYTGPSIVIQKYDNRTVEEYSINGNTYMQKITPRHGRPYYLTDPDGDGDLQWSRSAIGMDEQPPQWSLFSW